MALPTAEIRHLSARTGFGTPTQAEVNALGGSNV